MVSIVIPIYNASPYLAACLCSVAGQTYHDIEVIMVDDGSSDDSHAIAQAFVQADSRFRLYEQPNQGAAVARNAGMRCAQGEYLAFIDADDYIVADYIQQLVDAIKGADMVQCGYQRVADDGRILHTDAPTSAYKLTSPDMRLYRLDWLRKHRLSFPEGYIYEDVLFSLRVWAAKPRIVVLPYCGYQYRLNEHSVTSHHQWANIRRLFIAIQKESAPVWLKFYTVGRLLCHFVLLPFYPR